MSQDIINNRFLEESVFAIADGYCVINLTKNIVRGSMYQVVNGKKYNLNEQLGLPENSSLQSLVVFMLLTAYDTQKLSQMFSYYAYDGELAEKASIYGALTLYLDFINIFLYVVRLLGMNSRRRN